jgi:flagellar hook-length control protein FliK
MSVEIGGALVSVKTVPDAQSNKDKDKIKNGDDTDASAGGGFPGLLASIDPVAADAVTDAPAAAPLPVVADPLAPQDALPVNPPNDLAMLLAQAGAVSGRPPLAASLARGDLSATQKAKPLASLQASDGAPVLNPQLSAQALPMDLKALVGELGGDQSGALLVPVGSGEPAMGSGPAAKPLAGQEAKRLTLLRSFESTTELTQKSPADLKTQVVQMNVDTAPLLFSKVKTSDSQSGTGARLVEQNRLEAAAAPLGVSAQAPTLASAWLTSAMVEGLARPLDRFAAKSSVFSSDAGMGGILGQSGLPSENRLDASLALTPASTLSLETSVAETVSYWATQGVQNAELKLDGLGDHPVEVHISMKGDEAHIGFRTDQPEIRLLLEGASAHLKDLLKSEGLVLSGVSVGTSGQGNSQAPDQRSPAFARQTSLTTAPVVVAPSQSRAAATLVGAVDLFV